MAAWGFGLGLGAVDGGFGYRKLGDSVVALAGEGIGIAIESHESVLTFVALVGSLVGLVELWLEDAVLGLPVVMGVRKSVLVRSILQDVLCDRVPLVGGLDGAGDLGGLLGVVVLLLGVVEVSLAELVAAHPGFHCVALRRGVLVPVSRDEGGRHVVLALPPVLEGLLIRLLRRGVDLGHQIITDNFYIRSMDQGDIGLLTNKPKNGQPKAGPD